MEIIVLNQQQSKISVSRLHRMSQKLSVAVISNLKKKRPAWINTNALSFIEESSLNLIIVSDKEIKKLNKKWLKKDKITDVLSFPLVDMHNFDTEDIGLQVGLQDIGEIFIAYEKACHQAKEYNHSIDRELAFLFVHGMLHIVGFDHQDEISEKDMFARQKNILKQAGYPRELAGSNQVKIEKIK